MDNNHGKFNPGKRYQRIITSNKLAGELMPLGRKWLLPAEKTFINVGDTFNNLFIVKSGLVVGCEIYPNGMFREGLVMAPNSMFGEAMVLLNEPSPICFKTVLPTELICIPREVFLDALSQNQELNMMVIESLSKKFLSSMDEVRQMSYYNVTWRVCNLLRIFAEYHGEKFDGKIRITIPLSQHMVSRLLGVNRITTVRIMKKLKELHLLEQIDGSYWIPDLDKLIAYQDENGMSLSNN